MRKRVSVALLIVALIGLGAMAAYKFWPREPEPYNVETYLQRELKRLQAADLEDLAESEQRIKAALPPAATTDQLLRLFVDELYRRFRESLGPGQDLAPPGQPAGSNGWDAFMRAAGTAKAAESELGTDVYAVVDAGGALDKAAAKAALTATAEIPEALAEAHRADHATAAGWGYDLATSPPTTSLARMACVRAAAHLSLNDRAAGLADAEVALLAYSKVQMGHSLIARLVETVHWYILIDTMLIKLSWTADELATLLRSANPPQLDLANSLRAEASYAATLGEESGDPRYDSIMLGGILDDRYLPLGELIAAQLTRNEELVRSRLEQAALVAAYPGDAHDGEYLTQLKGRVDESDWISLRSCIRDSAENEVLLAAAKTRLGWLQGKRGDELLAMNRTALVAIRRNGEEVQFRIAHDHPLSRESSDDPVTTLRLPD